MATLLGLSDELLLKILSQVDASDLIALRKVCHRLDVLCCDHTLWNEADLSRQRLTCSSLSRLLSPVLAPVLMLSLRGLRNTTGLHSKQKLLTPHTIHLLAQHAPRLRHLVIRETIICARSINLECLSVLKNLQALSIINCEFINKPNTMDDGSWFSKLDKWLPKLEVLQITGTSFVEDYDIISIGKCYKLRKLILTNCTRVGIAMPYLAIAFRFGMHKLEHLDLRGTSLQNSDVLSIIYSGHIKELLLGPMGRVKRLLATPENMHNLIMADPRREEPPHQQVLVVNMGPDGPNWRQVQDDELDGLGLKWVREQNEVRRRLREQQEDKHFFIGENGHLLHPQRIDPGEGSSMSAAGGKKRKARHDVDGSRPPKKRKINADCEDGDKDDKDKEDSIDEYLGSSSDEDEDEVPACDKKVGNNTLNLGCCHDIDNDFVPDECLSDLFIGNIVSKGSSLTNLHLAGCAVTNHGLDLLLTHLPALESVNVMYSLVTQEYVEEVRKSHTHCKISDVRPSARRNDACTVFCAC